MVRICTSHSLTVHRLPPLCWAAPELSFVASTYSATSAYVPTGPHRREVRGVLLEGVVGLEPATSWLTATRSCHLNYAPVGCPDLSGSRSPVASWLARSLVMSCAPSLLPACQVMLSRFLRLTPTAGSDPVFLAQTAGFEPAKTCWIPPRSLHPCACPRVAALHAVGRLRLEVHHDHTCKSIVPSLIYARITSPVN